MVLFLHRIVEITPDRNSFQPGAFLVKAVKLGMVTVDNMGKECRLARRKYEDFVKSLP